LVQELLALRETASRVNVAHHMWRHTTGGQGAATVSSSHAQLEPTANAMSAAAPSALTRHAASMRAAATAVLPAPPGWSNAVLSRESEQDTECGRCSLASGARVGRDALARCLHARWAHVLDLEATPAWAGRIPGVVLSATWLGTAVPCAIRRATLLLWQVHDWRRSLAHLQTAQRQLVCGTRAPLNRGGGDCARCGPSHQAPLRRLQPREPALWPRGPGCERSWQGSPDHRRRHGPWVPRRLRRHGRHGAPRHAQNSDRVLSDAAKRKVSNAALSSTSIGHASVSRAPKLVHFGWGCCSSTPASATSGRRRARVAGGPRCKLGWLIASLCCLFCVSLFLLLQISFRCVACLLPLLC